MVLVTAATLATFQLTEVPRTPRLTALITEVTTVPVGKSVPGLLGSASPNGEYSSALPISPDTFSAVSGPPLTRSGKPEVLYVAAEYCPYCAMVNWR
jgi:hypothetical protein